MVQERMSAENWNKNSLLQLLDKYGLALLFVMLIVFGLIFSGDFFKGLNEFQDKQMGMIESQKKMTEMQAETQARINKALEIVYGIKLPNEAQIPQDLNNPENRQPPQN